MSTFIERSRRLQIVEATIEVLADHGYAKTTFVRIARRAGISPGLISYHFTDKAELTDQVRRTIYAKRVEHLQESIAKGDTCADRLRIAIESDMAFMGAHPELFRALVEVLFGERDDSGLPKYMTDTDPPMLATIRDLLVSGQQAGEFREFDPYYLAMVIDGARDQFLAQLPTRPSLRVDRFTETLVEFALDAVRRT